MLAGTFTVRPIPGTDKVKVGITGLSLMKLMLQTTAVYVVPVVALIVISDYMDNHPKKPTNTEDHFPKTDD